MALSYTDRAIVIMLMMHIEPDLIHEAIITLVKLWILIGLYQPTGLYLCLPLFIDETNMMLVMSSDNDAESVEESKTQVEQESAVVPDTSNSELKLYCMRLIILVKC